MNGRPWHLEVKFHFRTCCPIRIVNFHQVFTLYVQGHLKGPATVSSLQSSRCNKRETEREQLITPMNTCRDWNEEGWLEAWNMLEVQVNLWYIRILLSVCHLELGVFQVLSFKLFVNYVWTNAYFNVRLKTYSKFAIMGKTQIGFSSQLSQLPSL